MENWQWGEYFLFYFILFFIHKDPWLNGEDSRMPFCVIRDLSRKGFVTLWVDDD